MIPPAHHLTRSCRATQYPSAHHPSVPGRILPHRTSVALDAALQSLESPSARLHQHVQHMAALVKGGDKCAGVSGWAGCLDVC
jgi:hypothetical protein